MYILYFTLMPIQAFGAFKIRELLKNNNLNSIKERMA
jgi:hypothetical protein